MKNCDGPIYEQEHSLVEVRRHVDELTMLYELTLQIGSTLNQERIIQAGLQAIVQSLRYDQAWIALWNEEHQQFNKIHTHSESHA